MNGVLIVDKPRGSTSASIVRLIKKAYPQRKVGHVGTLDPLATGVLPICVGEATKIADYLPGTSKGYRFTALLGYTSRTLDTESDLVKVGDPGALDPAAISDVLDKLVGVREQQVPLYSAVKVGGTPLYKAARMGLEIEAPVKRVEICRIVLEGVNLPRIEVMVDCSKGTYIRALCAEIGRELGCGAVMEALCRLRSGNFDIHEAIRLPLADVTAVKELVAANIIPLVTIIKGMPHFIVADAVGARIRNGCQPTADVIASPQHAALVAGETVGFLDASGRPLALGRMLYGVSEVGSLPTSAPVVKILRVFNYDGIEQNTEEEEEKCWM